MIPRSLPPRLQAFVRVLALACWALGVLALTLSARAQTAPAGNAHPEAQAVSQHEGQLASPFGDPSFTQTRADLAATLAFSQQVDLSPLRDVAVFHNGRVKILDTLARETVLEITGRRTYQDFLVGDDGTPRKVSFDPLFTLFDLMIDPVAYVDRPLLHVEFLPLRRVFLDLALPNDPAAQQRYLTLTRLTPRMAAQHFVAVNDRVIEGRLPEGSAQQFRQGLDQINQAQQLWGESAGNMVLVAPESREAAWHHLSEPPTQATDEPSRAAWERAQSAALALGTAWRAGDAAAVNAAARDLSDALKAVHPPMYPGQRRALELAYNRVQAFEWGMYLYFLSLIGLVLAMGTARRTLAGLGMALLLAAVAMHGAGFVARCILAERFAIQNQFESMTGVSLFAAVVGLVLAGATRKWLFGAAAAATGFLVLIAATQTGIPGRFIEREAAILNTSVLLKYHVTTVLTSYGLITLGMVVSLFYLGAHYAKKSPALALAAGDPAGHPTEPTDAGARHRLLRDLDKAQMIVLQLAFWTLAVGILLGAWWADHSWGRWWAFDPKETWALITWIIYLIVIHVRFTTGGQRRGLVTAWLSVGGFIMMLWTYFGVNLFLPGLHAYA